MHKKIFEHNRESWNELTSLHIKSDFYDLKSFKKGNTSLNHVELEEIGEVKGKKLLHLQCHFGMDTLSYARMGADVTGIDISDESIKVATELSEELSLPAKFYRSNVYQNTATPLTIERYTLATEGGLQGLAHTIDQSGKARGNIKTHIENLYHAGQYSFPGAGIITVSISGNLCSEMILSEHFNN